MKSSRKFMTRVLTAALALSMVAGTGVCAAAVEETDLTEEPIVVIASDDSEETSEYAARLDAIKAMLTEAAQSAYAKISQSTVAQLAQIAQKVKAAEQIMADASSQVAQIQVDVADKVSEIRSSAEQLVAAVDDEETAAQIMEYVDLKVSQLLEEAEQQIESITSTAEEQSNALLAEATEQLDALKTELQKKAIYRQAVIIHTIGEIQQKIYEAKANIHEKIQEFRDWVPNAIVQIREYLIQKTTKYSYVTEGDFDYQICSNIRETYAVVMAYNGEDEEITIPAYVNDIPVTASLLAANSAVKTVNVPATFTDLSGISFAGLTELETINVDEENEYLMSVDGIVFDKTGVILFAVPQGREYNAPEGTEAIFELAYYKSKMSSVEIPSTVSYIGSQAFIYCSNLKKAIVPASVNTIGENAFAECSDEFVMELETVSCPAYVYARENGIKYTCPLSASVSLESEAFVDDGEHFIAMQLGASLEITGEAEGGSEEGYTYAFYTRKEGETKWSCKQSFKDNASIEFTPGFSGNYEICVKVKDSTGSMAKMYTEIYVLNAFENTSTISADTIKKGETVTVYLGANVNAPTAYAVYYKKTTDNAWTRKQDYTENEEVTIKPAKAADYVICVKAKNLSDGTISKKYFDLTVNPAK